MPFLFPVTMVDTQTAPNSQFQGGFFPFYCYLYPLLLILYYLYVLILGTQR